MDYESLVEIAGIELMLFAASQRRMYQVMY
jgi:hypothetical protein